MQFIGVIVIPDDQPTDVALNGPSSSGGTHHLAQSSSSTTPVMTPLPSQLLQNAANAASIAQQHQQQDHPIAPGATMAIQSLMNTNLLNNAPNTPPNQQ